MGGSSLICSAEPGASSFPKQDVPDKVCKVKRDEWQYRSLDSSSPAWVLRPTHAMQHTQQRGHVS
jgi:hypothetical protein